MSDSNRKLIEENLADLQRLARKKQQPNRFHARELLTALGELILAEGEGLPEVELVRAAVTPFEHWEKAVAEELSLACTEHIKGSIRAISTCRTTTSSTWWRLASASRRASRPSTPWGSRSPRTC